MSVANQVRDAAVRCGRALRALSPTAILVIGFAVFLLYAFPGYMSNDSVDQLLDARGHAFSDAHPPVMAAEWMILDAIIAGPLLMTMVQGALFLAGLAGLLRRVASPRAAAVLAVAILLFPPVLTTMAVVWKDCQMAAFLLAGTAALLSPRRRVRLLGWALVTLGCAFRHNAAAAAIPIVGLLFVWRPEQRWWRRYLISGAAAVLSVVAAISLNRALTTRHLASLDGVKLADIAGVLYFTHDRSDAELQEILRGVPLRHPTRIQATAREVLSMRSAMGVFYSETSLFAIPGPADHPAIDRAWRELVFGDFRSYLAYRGAAFCELLGLSSEDLWYPVYFQFLGDPEHRKLIFHNATWSQFQQLVVFVSGTLAFQTPLFRPYLYALLALLLLIVCCRDRMSFAVLASGLLYELSYFPAANTVDFRYSHWMIVCTALATVMLFARRLRAGHASPGDAAPVAEAVT